jgi:hypothetical protein
MVFLATSASAGNYSGGAKEYLVMKVFNRTKNTEVVPSLFIQTGESFPNSMKGKMENGEEGTIRILNDNGKITVIRTETDVMNYLASHGWELFSSHTIQALDRSYVQYVFVKEK